MSDGTIHLCLAIGAIALSVNAFIFRGWNMFLNKKIDRLRNMIERLEKTEKDRTPFEACPHAVRDRDGFGECVKCGDDYL